MVLEEGGVGALVGVLREQYRHAGLFLKKEKEKKTYVTILLPSYERGGLQILESQYVVGC
jgi:hypothetical protein